MLIIMVRKDSGATTGGISVALLTGTLTSTGFVSSIELVAQSPGAHCTSHRRLRVVAFLALRPMRAMPRRPGKAAARFVQQALGRIL